MKMKIMWCLVFALGLMQQNCIKTSVVGALSPAQAAAQLRILNDVQKLLMCWSLKSYQSYWYYDRSLQKDSKFAWMVALGLYDAKKMDIVTQNAVRSMLQSEIAFAELLTSCDHANQTELRKDLNLHRAQYFQWRKKLVELALGVQEKELELEYEKFFVTLSPSLYQKIMHACISKLNSENDEAGEEYWHHRRDENMGFEFDPNFKRKK